VCRQELLSRTRGEDPGPIRSHAVFLINSRSLFPVVPCDFPLGVPRPVHHSAFSQFAQAPLTAWFGPIQFCLAALDSTVTDRPQRLQPWSACKSPCPRFCLVCSSFSAGFGSVAGQLLGTSSSSRLRFLFMFLLLILPCVIVCLWCERFFLLYFSLATGCSLVIEPSVPWLEFF
jgi:hypothetical protein